MTNIVTVLTNQGWQGLTTGVWTPGADTVTNNIAGIVIHPDTTANTLSGDDAITGAGGVDTENAALTGLAPLHFGIENLGTLLMGRGVNSLAGTATGPKTALVYGIYSEADSTISMDGNCNSITGIATGDGSEFPGIFSIAGIYNRSGSITMGDGNNNSITGVGVATGAAVVDEGTGFLASGIFNRQGGTIAIGNGDNNSITGIGGYYNGIYNRGDLMIGDGNNNFITGIGISDGAYGIYNQTLPPDPSGGSGSIANITIGNGDNARITGVSIGNNGAGIVNEAGCTIKLGNGNHGSIAGIATGSGGTGIVNVGDIILGQGTGCIIGTGDSAGILNLGTINAGAGNDMIIANGGFRGNGSVLLGDGNDYLEGFGSGNFDGGNNEDILQLTKGTYTVGRSAETVTFTAAGTDITMTTTGFELLLAGTTYNFASLTSGQIITVY
ncbi:MAG TPA: hypothetical protein V6C46_07910 [Coleofasciculaceae cyanobacterium]